MGLMSVQLMRGDCLTLMRSLPDRSVDLIATDPPYYKVKGDAWDRQWETPAAFLAWFDLLAEQWQRLLRPNGSLYTFAWQKMAAHVEALIDRRFNVLQRITWAKPPFATKAEMFRKDDLRSFFPVTEAIIFAEHKGADNIAKDKDEPGYAAKCDELRGTIFEPLRSYLADERDRAGFTSSQVNIAFRLKTGNPKSGMAGHWFTPVQWALPTEANYAWLRELFGPGSLSQPFDELREMYERLRRQYDEARGRYENLRRPFTVTADVPYTDVWTFPTVPTRVGKHPCEKPPSMMEHIITASSREGGVVLDPFMGSGVTGEAAIRLGRKFIGMEADAGHFTSASRRIRGARLRSPEEVALRRVLTGVDPSDQPEEFI